MLFKLGVTIIITTTFLLIKSIECRSKLYHYYEEANPSLCNFFDTINITDGTVNNDRSITFDGVRYAKEDYGTFNFTYLPNQIKIQVAPYKRGCVCKYKNCVRLCCAIGHFFFDEVVDNKIKHSCVRNYLLDSILVDMHDGEHKKINLMNNLNMTLVSEKPCQSVYFLDPMIDPFDEWKLLSNGSLILTEDQLILNHDAYCLAHAYNESINKFELKAMLCATDPEPEKATLSVFIYPAVMLVSVCFLSLTLLVYVWIKELRRTVHGKNFMCYLSTLIMGYSFLAFSHIDNSHAHVGELKCLIFAEIIHTSFICGFIWLSVISFDIWRTIGRPDYHRHQFFKYCLFAFGITFVIVLLTNLMDTVELLPEVFRPGLGKTTCWLQDTKYAHFMYLYSVIIVVLTINTALFILTKLKIESLKRISVRASTSKDSTDFHRFGLFLRLFILMGLPWIIELMSWLFDLENFVMYVMDAVTMLQGPIIFFLFIKDALKN